MAHFWQHLRTGDWLTPERIRGYALIVLGLSLAGLIGWVALSDHMIDRKGKPLGTDFSNVYAAGVLTLSGRAPDAYDPPLQHAAEKAVFGGRDVPFYGWHYPPFFLMPAALLALLPYALALLCWLAVSLPAFIAAIHAIVPRRETLLAAAAFPAVFVNVGHGQNGFFTAALLGGCLILLDRRPALAGVLLGLLAYKPQFGVLIPLVLLVTGRWTTILSAAATVAALVVTTTVLFGMDVWHAFAESATFTRTVVLETGGTGWEKIQSLFSAVRMWGGGIDLAYAAQGALALTLAATMVWLWRSKAAFELKAAALAIASLLATPYVLDYDLVVLGVAIAFFVRHGLARGFQDYELSLLAAAWAVPFLTRSIAGATGIPLGLLVMIAFYAMTLRRAALDLGFTPFGSNRLVKA
ncbi:MAG TPA: glycosyltransferase family 87 protein [Afipia sp.]